jgi:FAD/FMN-containing dehydrogenase
MRPWLSSERVETLVERLNTLPDSWFEKLGVSRQVLEHELEPFQGELIFPYSPDYDKARRLSNPRFDLRPALIACCVCDSDVRICLLLFGASSVPFRIRAGGHSVMGYSEVDDGVVIDLSGLNDVSVDPILRTVTVGSGAQFEKIYHVLEGFKAHIPGGECLDVAVGGFMQGGGYSLSSRTFGMNCDNVLSLRIMLADGRIVRASKRTHHDLWWAVRGGTGNNFGVVLSVTYRLLRLETVYGWRLFWRLTSDQDRQRAADALVNVQETFSDAPREFNIQASVQYRKVTVDEATTVDQQVVAEAQLWIFGAYLGPSQQGRDAIAPLRQLPGAVFDFESEGTYSKVLGQLMLPYPYFVGHVPGTPPCDVGASRYIAQASAASYWTSQTWKQLLDYLFVPADQQWSSFWLEPYGGAITAYPLHKSAFIHRDVSFNACLEVFFDQSDLLRDPNGRIARSQAFLDGWRTLMQPAWNGEIYQNYPTEELAKDDQDAAYWGKAYWGKALPALIAVKRKYDPKRRFDFPQAIPGYDPGQISWPADVARALPRSIEPEAAVDIWSSRLWTLVRAWLNG